MLYEAKNFRFCIVTPSFKGGGAERIAVNLANEYTAHGHDVTLLVFQDIGEYKEQLCSEVKVKVVGKNRAYKIVLYVFKYFRDSNFSHVLSVIRDANIVIGFALLFNRKIKLIFREANELNAIKFYSYFKKIKFLFAMRLAYFRAELVIANSKKTKQDLIEQKITKPNKIKVIYNPVLADSYEINLQADCDFKFEKNGYYFLNLGRYHYQKNHVSLIRAFSRVAALSSRARLLILGEGDAAPELVSEIKNLNLVGKVILLPFQKNPFPYYRNSDCFVLSSRWEGFGNVIVEALASGLPVISTACGGPRCILQDNQYGVLVEQDNAEALASAMIDIMGGKKRFSPALLKMRGAEFTVSKKACEYLEEIRSL